MQKRIMAIGVVVMANANVHSALGGQISLVCIDDIRAVHVQFDPVQRTASFADSSSCKADITDDHVKWRECDPNGPSIYPKDTKFSSVYDYLLDRYTGILSLTQKWKDSNGNWQSGSVGYRCSVAKQKF